MKRSIEKLRSLDDLLQDLERERAAGRSVAMANGLFDVLHVGHLRYLEEAATEADLLVVAVNSDRSARQLKGPTRPVVPQSERAELLAGFSCVHSVVIFDETNVENLLRRIRPDVHCKGTDYTADSVPEARVARELRIRIAICGDAKQHSTRDLIQKMRAPSPSATEPKGSDERD